MEKRTIDELKIYWINPKRSFSIFPNNHSTSNMDEADLVVLESSYVINPELFGMSNNLGYNISKTADLSLINTFTLAKEKNKKILGLDNGSLMICALAGGGLMHNISTNGIAGTERVILSDLRYIYDTTLPSYCPYPFNCPSFNILGLSDFKLRNYTVNNSMPRGECFHGWTNICHYPSIDSLGINSLNFNRNTYEIRSIIEKFYNNELPEGNCYDVICDHIISEIYSRKMKLINIEPETLNKINRFSSEDFSKHFKISVSSEAAMYGTSGQPTDSIPDELGDELEVEEYNEDEDENLNEN